MRKRYKNESIGFKILTEKEIELLKKKKKKKMNINITISEPKDLKIRLINKLNKIEEIITEINKIEKEKIYH